MQMVSIREHQLRSCTYRTTVTDASDSRPGSQALNRWGLDQTLRFGEPSFGKDGYDTDGMLIWNFLCKS